MYNSVSSDDLKNRFELKIQQGCELLSSLDEFKNLLGITKVKKKIKRELTFLKKMLTNQSLKNEHLLSTNLHHFDALVSCIFNSNDVVSVLETKSYRDELNYNSHKKLCIDIICEGGRKWIKVIARNPKALSQILSGHGDYGQKSIVDHAVQYQSCAEQNHFMFEPPQVCFFFASGLTTSLANSLNRVNVCVIGTEIYEDSNEQESELLSNDSEQLYSDTDSDSLSDEVNTATTSAECKFSSNLVPTRQDVSTINLDVSTMIAYVSALTNGGCNWTFKEPLLNQQAEWERARPVKPILDDIFYGKNLICCETAWKSFKEIVDIIGGSSEKERTKALMSIVKVVPDIKYTGLKLGGKIKPRSVIIFGTGYHHRAVTVTANEGFIRAAKHQNSDFAVIIHESRALTEIKQENCLQL